MNDTALETDRLILRTWREEDLEPFAAMNADSRVMEYFPSTLSASESADFFQRIQKDFNVGFSYFAAELKASGDFIGFIGLNKPNFSAHFIPCVEVGWRLAHRFWGKGLATEGARAALNYGFKTLGLREIVSFTTVANFRSRHVMDKLGMSHDPSDDFDHPRVPEGHLLRRHVLYRLSLIAH